MQLTDWSKQFRRACFHKQTSTRVETFMPSPPDSVGESIKILQAVPLTRLSVRSFVQLPRYIMNGLNNFDKTDKEYSPAPNDDLFRFWRSKVKGQGHSGPTYMEAKAYTSTLGLGHASSGSTCNNLFLQVKGHQLVTQEAENLKTRTLFDKNRATSLRENRMNDLLKTLLGNNFYPSLVFSK